MKRLKLDAFKAKNINSNKIQPIDQLLGQVLGDCHDQPNSSGSDRGGYNVGDLDTEA